MLGYEAPLVCGFLREFAEYDGDCLVAINGVRVLPSRRKTFERWERDGGVVPMSRVDAYLLSHDLMLFELEMWANEHYGYDGTGDTATNS